MDFGALLIGYAQIAISLAAFTTIASVVAQVSENTSANLIAVRLKLTLLFSLHLLVLAVLPTVIYQIAPGADEFWRYSAIGASISFAIAAGISVFGELPRVLRDSKNSWVQTILSLVFGFASGGADIFAIWSGAPDFWYLLSMALALACTLTMVVGLVLSFPVFDVHRKDYEPAVEETSRGQKGS